MDESCHVHLTHASVVNYFLHNWHAEVNCDTENNAKLLRHILVHHLTDVVISAVEILCQFTAFVLIVCDL